MVVVGLCATEGHCTSGRPPIRCKTVLRRVRCDLQHTAGFCVTYAQARHHCAGCLFGRRRSTRACDARAPRRDGCGQSMRHGRPPHQREASYSLQGRAATCRLRPPTHSRLSRDTRAGAPPLRWLSLGMRRSTRARDARAPRRDGCGRSMRNERPLHQREASHLVQDRGATFLLRPPTHSRLLCGKRAGAPPLRWLSLGMRRSTRACVARAPLRDGCDRSMRHGRSLHQREASYSVQDRATTCLLWPPTHGRLSRDKRAGATLRWLSLGRRRSTRACDARAVRRAGFDRSMHPGRPPHQRDASTNRCEAVVQYARCGLPHSGLSRDKRAGATLRWLSLGRRRSTRACDARALRRDGCGRPVRY